MVLLTTIRSPTWTFQRIYYWTSKIQDGHLENRRIAIPEHHPILIKFGTQMHIWNSVTAKYEKF